MSVDLHRSDIRMAGPSNRPAQKAKSKKQPLCKRLGHYCYNKEAKTCMNRSGKACSLLLIYYILFVGAMTIIFILLWYGISDQTLKLDTRPYVKIQHSNSPRPTIVPTLLSSSQELGVWYFLSGGEGENANIYVDEITSFLEGEEEKCKKVGKCPFSRDNFGPCSEEDYGYGSKMPCIFIKLNVVDNFSPTAFGTDSNIPNDTPKELKEEIDVSRKTLWANCEGKTPYDAEHIGKMKYYPGRAFKDEFFPTSEKTQVNPFLAVQLVDLTTDLVLTVECRVFGNNYDRKMSDVEAYLYVGA